MKLRYPGENKEKSLSECQRSSSKSQNEKPLKVSDVYSINES